MISQLLSHSKDLLFVEKFKILKWNLINAYVLEALLGNLKCKWKMSKSWVGNWVTNICNHGKLFIFKVVWILSYMETNRKDLHQGICPTSLSSLSQQKLESGHFSSSAKLLPGTIHHHFLPGLSQTPVSLFWFLLLFHLLSFQKLEESW